MISVDQKFWAKVEKTAGCWWWRGIADRDGYGLFYVPTDRSRRAHRVSYELLVGPIPEGLELDHLCRNPPCVNPAHLEPVTSRENTLRGEGPTAQNARKTHCLRGHPFDEASYRVDGTGRICRECQRISARRAKAAKREAERADPAPVPSTEGVRSAAPAEHLFGADEYRRGHWDEAA